MSRRAPRFALIAPVVPEHDLQRQIARILTIEVARQGHISDAGVVWWSVDQANVADSVPGIRMGRGCVAGIPDMHVLFQGRSYFIELKTQAGALSEPQRWLASSLVLASAALGVARSAEEVLALLDQWQIPRKRRVQLQ